MENLCDGNGFAMQCMDQKVTLVETGSLNLALPGLEWYQHEKGPGSGPQDPCHIALTQLRACRSCFKTTQFKSDIHLFGRTWCFISQSTADDAPLLRIFTCQALRGRYEGERYLFKLRGQVDEVLFEKAVAFDSNGI